MSIAAGADVPSRGLVDRAVITIAMGKPYYTQLAVNLARSFLQWHPRGEIEFHLVTNHPELVPPDLAAVRVRTVQPGELGVGFGAKLHLDRVAPARHTLFLDADCLVFGPLDDVFAKLAGRAVAVPGSLISEGDFSGDVTSVRARLGLPGLIQFVGGIYYLEPGPVCTAVFEEARRLEPMYDDLGLVRLRGLPNEEPLLSIAMVRHGLAPLHDDGSVKADALCYPSAFDVDVFRGRAHVVNDPADPDHFRNWPCTEARPRIVHFNCNFAEKDPYLREVARLERVRARHWPLPVATAYAWAAALPRAVRKRLKDLLRPTYRRIFGTRPIAATPRL